MIRRLVVALAVCGVTGCAAGPEAPKLVPASGKLLYRDRPVANALVSFLPLSAEGRAEAAQGTTDASGAFTLACPSHGPGATPGKYKVTVSFYGGTGPVPERFAAADKTPLRAEVPPGGTDRLVLVLQD
jgi:hypothetical protein